MSGRRDDEFTEYVTERMWWLRRLAYLLCQDWPRADDLVQSTITRLYMHWGRAAAVEHTDGYVRTILVREYLSERRSGWARRVSLTAEPRIQPACRGPRGRAGPAVALPPIHCCGPSAKPGSLTAAASATSPTCAATAAPAPALPPATR